ncbi:5813_t:CDS:1, partial [Scutellospora calospora]
SLTKEPTLNAFSGLDPLKWIQFDELKNVNCLAKYECCNFYSAKWIDNQNKREGTIEVILISPINKTHLKCHDKVSMHDILGISQDPQN